MLGSPARSRPCPRAPGRDVCVAGPPQAGRSECRRGRCSSVARHRFGPQSAGTTEHRDAGHKRGGSWSRIRRGSVPAHDDRAPRPHDRSCRGRHRPRAREHERWSNPPRPARTACRPCARQPARGLDALPHAEHLPAGEQRIDPPPRPVPLGHIPPRATRPSPVPDPIDQVPHRILPRPPPPRRGRQQRLQHHPLCVTQVVPRRDRYRGHEASRSDLVIRHHLSYCGGLTSCPKTRRCHISNFRNRP